MISKIAERATLIAPVLLFISFLHVYMFYNQFGIEIQDWTSLGEILLLFAEDGTTFIKYAVPLLALVWLTIWIVDNPNQFSGRSRVIFNIIKIIAVLTLCGMIFYLGIESEKDFIGKALNTFLSFVVIFFLGFILFVRGNSPVTKHTFNELNILTITLLLAFLLNAVFSSSKKYERIQTAELSKVRLTNGERLDSVRYIGKSEDYYFFSKRGEGIVVPKENIEYLKVPEKFQFIANKPGAVD